MNNGKALRSRVPVQRVKARGATCARMALIVAEDEAASEQAIKVFVEGYPPERRTQRLRRLARRLLTELGLNHETASHFGALAGQASLAATREGAND